MHDLFYILQLVFRGHMKVGEWRAKNKPIIWKKFKEESRPQYSYFRYGLDFIRNVALNPSEMKKEFNRCLCNIYPVSPASLEGFI